MRNDYTMNWSLRRLKKSRKWQRRHRHIECCRNALHSLDEVIKYKQSLRNDHEANNRLLYKVWKH